jgi:membrane protein required for colicin V production
MGALDIGMGLLLIWGLWRGMANGLILEVAAIAALIAGIYGAVHFSDRTANYLSHQWNWEGNNLQIAAFIITFGAIVILVHLAGKLLTKVASLVFLGMLNKIAGGLFGALKVAVIMGALILYFERFDAHLGILDEETKAASALYGPVKELGSVIFGAVFPTEQFL